MDIPDASRIKEIDGFIQSNHYSLQLFYKTCVFAKKENYAHENFKNDANLKEDECFIEML